MTRFTDCQNNEVYTVMFNQNKIVLVPGTNDLPTLQCVLVPAKPWLLQPYLVFTFSARNAAQIFFQLLMTMSVGIQTQILFAKMKYAQK